MSATEEILARAAEASERRGSGGLEGRDLAALRDPEHLMRYASLGQMRVERLTYGFHTGAQLILLSILRGNEEMDGELEKCRDMLIAADRDWFNGKRGTGTWLPPLAVDLPIPHA